jgi:hypothetical protein
MAINVHNHNQNATNETSFNLKGIMVGNGVTNWNYDTIPASLEIAYQRGLLDQATYDKIEEWGCNFTTVAPMGGDATPVECNEIIARWGMLTNKIDIYNIYGKCWEPKNTTKPQAAAQPKFIMDNGQFYSVSDDKKEEPVEDKHKLTKAFRTPWLNKGFKNHNESDVPKCVYAENLISYFNKAEVKTALHVDDSFISGPNKWGMCISNYANNTDTNFTGNYTMEIEASQWIWETLVNAN